MKLWNKSICITSRKTLLLIIVVFLSTLVLASVWPTKAEEIKIIKPILEKPWSPSPEDVAFQDSMFSIIEKTQRDLDTIRAGIDKILWKLERFDYPDGTWDSIRYVKGGAVTGPTWGCRFPMPNSRVPKDWPRPLSSANRLSDRIRSVSCWVTIFSTVRVFPKFCCVPSNSPGED